MWLEAACDLSVRDVCALYAKHVQTSIGAGGCPIGILSQTSRTAPNGKSRKSLQTKSAPDQAWCSDARLKHRSAVARMNPPL